MSATDGPGPFGLLLQRHRLAAGLSQEELAERAGLSRRGISDLERGMRRLPHPASVRRLADALGLTQSERAALVSAAHPPNGTPNPDVAPPPNRPADGRREATAPTLSQVQWVASERRHDNLPVAFTTFIGRRRECTELQRLLDTTRLLVLVGVGGVGKTRLGLEVAASVVDTFADGVWLVELAALSDPQLVAQQVSTALELCDSTRPPLDVLADYLRRRELLLVLDNCEHLIEACAGLAEHLLAHCAHLKILATSREPLGINGETDWRVPSLSIPAQNAALSAAELDVYEGTRLFIERARSAQANLDLIDLNASAVGQICSKLDGLPLAIELAAARVAVLPVEQMVERLNDRFGLLTDGSRTALARQQTLRATIDWSYDLLTPAEQMLFERLAIFNGQFTLEAVESVCVGGIVEQPHILDLLAHLVGKSLVLAEPGAREARFRLLETLRQYGLERLAATGAMDEMRSKHARYYVALVRQAEPHFWGPERSAWFEQLDNALDNLRSALRWCREHDPTAGLQMAANLWMFWRGRSSFREGRRCLQELLEQAPTAGRERAAGLVVAGHFAARLSELSHAHRLLDEGRALYAELKDEQGLGRAEWLSGFLATVEGRFGEAHALLHQGIQRLRATNDVPYLAWALEHAGLLAQRRGDNVQARMAFQESMAIRRGMRDDSDVAWTLTWLGRVAGREGDLREARAFLEEALASFRRMHDNTGIGRTLSHLGNVAIHENDISGGQLLLAQALALLESIGDRSGICDCLGFCGVMAIRAGIPDVAARLLATAVALEAQSGSTLTAEARAERDAAVETARALLGDEQFAIEWRAGCALPVEEAVQQAASIPLATPSQGSEANASAVLIERERRLVRLPSRRLSNRQIAQ